MQAFFLLLSKAISYTTNKQPLLMITHTHTKNTIISKQISETFEKKGRKTSEKNKYCNITQKLISYIFMEQKATIITVKTSKKTRNLNATSTRALISVRFRLNVVSSFKKSEN